MLGLLGLFFEFGLALGVVHQDDLSLAVFARDQRQVFYVIDPLEPDRNENARQHPATIGRRFSDEQMRQAKQQGAGGNDELSALVRDGQHQEQRQPDHEKHRCIERGGALIASGRGR